MQQARRNENLGQKSGCVSGEEGGELRGDGGTLAGRRQISSLGLPLAAFFGCITWPLKAFISLSRKRGMK